MATQYYDKNGTPISADFARHIQQSGGTVTKQDSTGAVNTTGGSASTPQTSQAAVSGGKTYGAYSQPTAAYGAWIDNDNQIDRLQAANAIAPDTYHRNQLRAANPSYNDYYLVYDGFDMYDRNGNLMARDADMAAQRAILDGETYNTYGMSPGYLSWLQSQGYTDYYDPQNDVYGATYTGTFGDGYTDLGYPAGYDHTMQQSVSRGSSGTSGGSGSGAYSSGYGGGYSAMQDAADAQYAAAMAQYGLAEDQINSGYDALAKQAYTQMRLGEKNLPYATSSYSSGTADSLALQNRLAYQNYTNANEAARLNDLAALEAQKQQAAADYQMQQAQMQYNYDMMMAEYEQEQELARMQYEQELALAQMKDTTKQKAAGTVSSTGYDWGPVDAVQLVQSSLLTENEFRRRKSLNSFYGTDGNLPYETYEDYVEQALKDRKNSGALTTSEYNRLRAIYGV